MSNATWYTPQRCNVSNVTDVRTLVRTLVKSSRVTATNVIIILSIIIFYNTKFILNSSTQSPQQYSKQGGVGIMGARIAVVMVDVTVVMTRAPLK